MVIVLPEDNLHFSTRDAPILASVADHLALAISRNATEQALRRSEEKHRLIFENATEGIFQASLDHDLLNANPALARILGYPDVESLMRHRKGFLRHLLSDKDRLTLMDQVLNQGRIDNFETSMSEGNKTRGWLSINMRTVQHPDGSIAYLEGSMRNVSQRKEAEQKLAVQKSLFQQLFDNSPQGILLLGADGAPQNLNLSFTAMFGFTRDDVDSSSRSSCPLTAWRKTTPSWQRSCKAPPRARKPSAATRTDMSFPCPCSATPTCWTAK